MNQTYDTAGPGLATSTPGRAIRIVETAAIAATAAFAGGGLLTQTVIVPHWRDMDPAAFLPHFAIYGPATGATLFPIEVAAVLLLGITTYSNARNRRPGRLTWALATAGMVATVVLLPVYFAGANLAMLDPAFPPQAVAAELTAWYRWNWVRTGLAVLATVLCCAALTAGRGSPDSVARPARGERPATAEQRT